MKRPGSFTWCGKVAAIVLLCTFGTAFAQPVWLCAGQSNMAYGHVSPATQAKHPGVHAVGRLGSACWAFAVRLNDGTGADVWVTQAAVPNSEIYGWLAPEANADPLLRPFLAVRDGRWGKLWARHIAWRIGSMDIAGVAYWQGESDLGHPRAYRVLLRGLIRSWRAAWGVNMPFVFVQLPSGGGMASSDTCAALPPTPPDDGWFAEMRDAYVEALKEAQTGMVITADLPWGIHPAHREIFGARLADVALDVAYGWQFPYSGPVYDSMAVEGAAIRIRFKPNTADGLQPIGAPTVQGFEIAGQDGKFVWADAAIDGADVIVSSPQVRVPVAVRYAWGECPRWANLFNGAGLVAAPFSTDH